jgi:hypothetical protein
MTATTLSAVKLIQPTTKTILKLDLVNHAASTAGLALKRSLFPGFANIPGP